MHGSGFNQAALQRGQRVIGISWGHIVHIRHVSQNHWNVVECFFWLCNLCLSSCGGHSFVTCHESVFICVSTELHTFLMEFYRRPPSDYLSRYLLLFSRDLHFSRLQTATIKCSDCKISKFSLFLFPTGGERKSAPKGRESKEPGEERSRPCSASSWYEAENKSLFS